MDAPCSLCPPKLDRAKEDDLWHLNSGLWLLTSGLFFSYAVHLCIKNNCLSLYYGSLIGDILTTSNTCCDPTPTQYRSSGMLGTPRLGAHFQSLSLHAKASISTRISGVARADTHINVMHGSFPSSHDASTLRRWPGSISPTRYIVNLMTSEISIPAIWRLWWMLTRAIRNCSIGFAGKLPSGSIPTWPERTSHRWLPDISIPWL